MSVITFDIVYKKKTDNDSFKLSPDSEYYQLKLMISGKYRIFDITKVYIYHKGELLSCNDKTKLREIFKQRKIKLEISTEKQKTNQQQFRYYCKCKGGASYICDKCDEFLCDQCYKKKKHITHANKIVKLKDYSSYVKNTLKEIATELDDKIINDEAFQFFSYWNYDLNTEITNINQCYEYIKQQIEDMKQMQIDYLMNIGNYAKYNGLKEEIENVIKEFANVNINEEFEKMLIEKRKIISHSSDVLYKFGELKTNLLAYTNTLKDMDMFNQGLLKDIKDKFTSIKKKFYLSSANVNTISYPTSTLMSNNYLSKSQQDIKRSLNSTNNQIMHSFVDNNTMTSNNPLCMSQNLKVNNNNMTLTNINNNSTILHDKLLFKIKDERKIIIFSLNNQTFKEKNYIDNSSFKTNLTNEADITQLNLNNKLYILSGKKYNKLYFYDYVSNGIYFIANTLYSHYYGTMTYVPKNNSIYFIGGNNQTKCERFSLDENKIKALPQLNEERQEFASMYYNDHIYVFFGFSPKKGINLSSIERINVETNDQFEVIYINEQITLSSLACARYIDEDENEESTDEILLLGGFDGSNYVDTSLVFNAREMKIRDCDIIIPNMNKHFQFLFQKESTFIEIDGNLQMAFDMKNNVHLISKESYELFSEVPA